MGLKIGDEVYIHGYVDEIRKDTIIVRNEGGYFGTVKSEVIPAKTTIGIREEDLVKVMMEGLKIDV